MRLAALIVGILLSISASVNACTLYAANGITVEGGGSLIAKIRDFIPGVQDVRLIPRSAKDKYSVYALYGSNVRGKPNICVGGVNEKGLVAMAATAGSIPKAERVSMPRRAITRKILSNCATVDEALTLECLGPRFLMLADNKEIAYLEIGDNGKTAIKRIQNNILAHTNHYLEDSLQYLNIRVGESSLKRYERISQLLNGDHEPYSMDSFKVISEDRNDGPNNSLWREGLSINKTQTLASFIVRIKENSDFDVYLKYRKQPNEKGKEKIIEMSRRDIFG